MNPHMMLSSGPGTQKTTALRNRLSAWHDAMVAHERRLRAGATSDVCDDECPHVEARALWLEAVGAFGARAQELTFLRSRGDQTQQSGASGASARRSEEFGERPLATAKSESTRRNAIKWQLR